MLENADDCTKVLRKDLWDRTRFFELARMATYALFEELHDSNGLQNSFLASFRHITEPSVFHCQTVEPSINKSLITFSCRSSMRCPCCLAVDAEAVHEISNCNKGRYHKSARLRQQRYMQGSKLSGHQRRWRPIHIHVTAKRVESARPPRTSSPYPGALTHHLRSATS